VNVSQSSIVSSQIPFQLGSVAGANRITRTIVCAPPLTSSAYRSGMPATRSVRSALDAPYGPPTHQNHCGDE